MSLGCFGLTQYECSGSISRVALEARAPASKSFARWQFQATPCLRGQPEGRKMSDMYNWRRPRRPAGRAEPHLHCCCRTTLGRLAWSRYNAQPVGLRRNSERFEDALGLSPFSRDASRRLGALLHLQDVLKCSQELSQSSGQVYRSVVQDNNYHV